MCPTEVCEDIIVRFVVAPESLIVEVVDDGPGFDACALPQSEEEVGGLGLVIIRSVMDEVDVLCDPQTGTCVRMTKYRNRQYA